MRAPIAAMLRRLGFAEVIERYDVSRENMGRALKEFGDRAEGAEWAVVYFAGHGLEMNGATYLVPVDAELRRDTHVGDETLSLTHVQAKVDAASKLGLVILDACRNNPFLSRMVRTAGATRSIGRGLPPVEPEGNVLVADAAKHGTMAEDGSGEEHGPFTEALLAHMEEPGLEINFLFRKVRDRVPRQDGQASGAVPLWLARKRAAFLQERGCAIDRFRSVVASIATRPCQTKCAATHAWRCRCSQPFVAFPTT